MTSSNKKVLARMTVIKKNGQRIIVEVREGATFSSFYHFHIQTGRRRSTKRATRTANRNEGLDTLNANMQKPGMDKIARRFEAQPDVVDVKVRIIRKKAYRRLLQDDLALTMCAHPGPTRLTAIPTYLDFDASIFKKAAQRASVG